MQPRLSPVVAPLALALPHPPLPSRRSSLLSNDARLPRTPTCGSPVPLLFGSSNNSNNRKSSDSWGSYDELDEVEHEWKTEHTALLTRTLDALPAHMITPFGGALPSNLLDKVARGILTAKGSEDWPHSIRATRLKLIEIVRARAKDERRKSIIKEEGSDEQHDGSPGRRPLYRQSSMEFMHSASIGSTEAIGRLSSRLQRADRSNSGSHHPFTRQVPRTPSKTNGARMLSGLNPRTPSQSTLISTTKRNSVSSVMSGSSDGYNAAPLLDPRVQRIRRSDSWGSVAMQLDSQNTPPLQFQGTSQTSPTRPLKRAPSYSSASSVSEVNKFDADGFLRIRKDSAESTLSSDEEDKKRTRTVKKARRRSPTPAPPPSSLPCSPELPGDDPFGSMPLKSPRETGAPTPARTRKPTLSGTAPRARGNPQRNPSMFGPELPVVAATATARPSSPMSACPSSFRGAPVPAIAVSPVPVAPGASSSAGADPSTSTRPQPTKRSREPSSPHPADSPSSQPRLRRVKATNFVNARRISFSSLTAAAENCIQPGYAVAGFGGGEAPTGGLTLDGAFELH